jgi:pimeloyl-ACP methyl ester carboxylesterase
MPLRQNGDELGLRCYGSRPIMAAMSSLQSKFVVVGGRRLHYLEAGRGEPVLLLHGWPTNAQLWRDTLGPLSETRRAIALDLPGFGLSDKPLDVRYSFRFFDEVLDSFTAAIGVRRTGLVVHDLGGPIGLHWATRRPERLIDLAILNTLVFPNPSWAVKLFVAATFVPFLRDFLSSPSGIRAALRLGVHDKARITPEVAALYANPYAGHAARRALLAAAQGLSARGLSDIARGLGTLSCPVRLAYGTRDKVLPDVAATMSRLKELFPTAELTALHDCGHFLQEDRGPEVAKILSAFFSIPRTQPAGTSGIAC